MPVQDYRPSHLCTKPPSGLKTHVKQLVVFLSLAISSGMALAAQTVQADAKPPIIAESRGANQPPEVDPGNDQVVAERGSNGKSVTVKLKAKAADLDAPLTYAWTQTDTSGIKVKLSNTKILNPTFLTPEVKQDTVLTFRLSVKDKLGAIGTGDVNITVKQVNRAPKANAGTDQTVTSNSTATLSGSGTDPDGDALSYAWTQTDTTGVKATLSDATVAAPTFTAPSVTQNTTLTFKLTVTDPGKLSATDSVDVVVKPLVQPPPAPTNVKAIAGSGQVALMWDSVANATGYDVCIAKQSIGEVANCTTYTGGTWLIDKTSPMTITGLTNDTAYYFRVVAKNASGDSAGSTEVTATPKASGLTAISAGDYHTCAVVNGGVQCWGYNSNGQLGDGKTTDSLTPVVAIPAGSGVTAVAAGTYHTCAIINGGVKCWGSNGNGELGDGSTLDRSKPTQVYGITANATGITAGNGNGYTCAIVNSGVQCWGNNGYGQLGNGTFTNSRKPVQTIAAGSGATTLAASYSNVCAVVNGGVQCWGYNSYGQLGDGTYTTRTKPIQTIAAGSGVTAVNVSPTHSCALVANAVQCWGYNSYGQFGNGTTEHSNLPIEIVPADAGATAVSVGYGYTCVVINGGVQCAGTNDSGQLGNGGSEHDYDTLFVEAIAANSGVTNLVSSLYSNYAFVSGAIQCWGYNGNGQLGNGNTENQFTPVAGPTF
ncbi:MAG: hypothetical protein RI964_2282 [Pseudomonadota bacterium]